MIYEWMKRPSGILDLMPAGSVNFMSGGSIATIQHLGDRRWKASVEFEGKSYWALIGAPKRGKGIVEEWLYSKCGEWADRRHSIIETRKQEQTMEASTETAKPLSPKQQRAAQIKEANRQRIARLKAAKDEKRKARAAKPKPAKKASGFSSAAKKAEAAAKREAAAAELKPVAKEVNHRLEQAKSLDGKADDHRLAAALKLKEAEEKCKAAGIAFKAWSDQHVQGQSFETVRKLLAVGKSEDPKLALADLRAKNALANKELRERKKEAAAQPKETPAQAEVQPKEIIGDAKARGDALERGETVVLRGAEEVVAKTGPAEDAETLYRAKGEVLSGVDALKAAFGTLKASDKMAFVEWAALEIGAKLVTEFDDAVVEVPPGPVGDPKPAKAKPKLVRKK